jgi:hypothetical protein
VSAQPRNSTHKADDECYRRSAGTVEHYPNKDRDAAIADILQKNVP